MENDKCGAIDGGGTRDFPGKPTPVRAGHKKARPRPLQARAALSLRDQRHERLLGCVVHQGVRVAGGRGKLTGQLPDHSLEFLPQDFGVDG